MTHFVIAVLILYFVWLELASYGTLNSMDGNFPEMFFSARASVAGIGAIPVSNYECILISSLYKRYIFGGQRRRASKPY